jgi:hypothetical protein
VSDRRHDAFFYGLFMDEAVLAENGVMGANPRLAYAEGFAVRIGNRATLVPSASDRAYGVVFSMTQDDLERLYGGPGLEAYRPEPITVRALEGDTLTAICYNLAEPPAPHERNAEYAARLRRVLHACGFPKHYIDGIG